MGDGIPLSMVVVVVDVELVDVDVLDDAVTGDSAASVLAASSPEQAAKMTASAISRTMGRRFMAGEG